MPILMPIYPKRMQTFPICSLQLTDKVQGIDQILTTVEPQ